MEIIAFQGTVAAVIVGVVEVLGRAGFNKEKWGGLTALVLGVAAAVGGGLSGTIVPSVSSGMLVLAGAITGLTAAGAYSGTRAILKN